MTHENVFKHQQLQAKTQIDVQKLALEGHKVGVNNQAQMAQLASQLMKDQSDQDGQDQQNQLDAAHAQNESDQVAQQGQQQQSDAQLKAAQLASQHMQAMHKLNLGHSQAMTELASSASRGDDRAWNEGGADRGRRAVAGHGSAITRLNRPISIGSIRLRPPRPTLGNQQKIAKMRPAVGR